MTRDISVRARPALAPPAALLVVAMVLGSGCPRQEQERYEAPTDLAEPADEEPEREIPEHPPVGEAVFHHFDVGQADATLIRAPEGTILIDAGHWQRDDVVPYIRGAGVSEIDVVAISHPHADHLGQVPEVVEAFDVGEVWMSGYEHESATFERAVDAVLEAEGTGYHEPKAGAVEEFGDLIVEVLNPERNPAHVHDNLALRVRYGEFAAVYTGDAEEEHEAGMIAWAKAAGAGEDAVAAADGAEGEAAGEAAEDASGDAPDGPLDALAAQLLQLGHHGSRTSSSSAFLRAVSPEVVVYSAAKDSQYDHPHAEVISRIEELGIDIYGTPTSGTIVVRTNGDGYEIEEQGDALAVADTGGAGTGSADGCIDINRASKEELQELAHTGPARAERIIEERPYESLDGLHRVHGFGESRVADIKAEGLACIE